MLTTLRQSLLRQAYFGRLTSAGSAQAAQAAQAVQAVTAPLEKGG